MNSKSVACVMVSYNPIAEKIFESINSILANDVTLIVVDNGSSNRTQILKLVDGSPKAIFISLDVNIGIAAAQNVGIKIALDKDFEYIWLSDQDTIYEPNFSKEMIGCFKVPDDNVAAIGPSFYDTNRGSVQPIVVFSPFTTKKQPSPGLNSVSHMISSGMFIPSQKIREIGLKQDDLFIDWVDMEWCWRAENLFNQKLFVTGDVQIEHTLGDTYKNFLGRKVILRSSFRHYFMVRNAIGLSIYSKSLAPFTRVELFAKAVIWMLLLPMLAPSNKLQHLNSTVTGALHGLINRLGPAKGIRLRQA